MRQGPACGQRGAAALTVTLVLFFIMTLIAAFANRNHLFEQRASANQYRAVQAFNAAEAGVDWAIAMLNDPQPIDERCVASPTATTSFRERYLAVDPARGLQTPRTWSDAGTTTALRMVCMRNAGSWNCACPVSGEPHLADADGATPAPAFSVEFAADPHARAVRLRATGCSSFASPCSGGDDTVADAQATVQVSLGLLPGLATPPLAPLTVKGDVQAGSAAIGLHHLEAATGGFTVHAGGSVHAANARLTTAPGAVASASIAEGDGALNSLPASRLFAALFGVDKALWQQHPAVKRVQCTGDCGATLLDAMGVGLVHRLIWVDGDMQLSGSTSFGTPQRPVIIIASGAVELHGDVVIHGVIYGASLAWQDGSGAHGAVRGAAISESGYQGDASADFVYDSGVLSALMTGTGTFAVVPGSWKDF